MNSRLDLLAIEDSHPRYEPTTVNEEEDVQFDISLSSEIGESGEEGSSVASEVFEESPGPMEKDELPSLLNLKLESEEAGNTAEIAELPSAPAEPEAKVSTLHSSTKEEPEAKSDDSPETQPMLSETTTAQPLANDNVSLPEPTLIPKETPENTVASHWQEVGMKTDAAADKH
jgi:hypothetical protein